jgi:hypothetical protein
MFFSRPFRLLERYLDAQRLKSQALRSFIAQRPVD